MSMIWYPPLGGIESAFEIAVDDPGYGMLWLRVLWPTCTYLGLEETGWEVELAGGELGAWSSELATRALCATGEYERSWEIAEALPRRRRTDVPSWVTTEVARALLPAFTNAVLLAAGGGERYERIHVDEGAAPQPPICVRCDEGSSYYGQDATSKYCAEHGHAPFGSRRRSWDDAVAWAEWEQREYDRRRSWREQREGFDRRVERIGLEGASA